MIRKNLLFIIAAIIVLFVVGGVFAFKELSVPKKTHYHAGFVVFQNNKKLDFSDNKYMFIEPCALNEKGDDSPSDIQIEKAHLHDNVGDEVHIERTGGVWKDLFTNINFSINYSQTTGYINGRETPNFEFQPIHADDSLVVFIGKNDKELLSQAVTKDYIEKMAKKSSTCGD